MNNFLYISVSLQIFYIEMVNNCMIFLKNKYKLVSRNQLLINYILPLPKYLFLLLELPRRVASSHIFWIAAYFSTLKAI